MSDTPVKNEQMEDRIVRFEELKQRGTPLMFIDSILPGHHRMNFSVIGDTASENDEYDAALTQPHTFQIGMVKAPPGNGPAYHTHDYVEVFMPLSGKWRFYWGHNAEDPQDVAGEALLEPWDFISLPAGLWRRFENVSDDHAWILGILDEHTVFEGKDPYWSPTVIRQAEEKGFQADENGKMIKPDNYAELRARMEEQMTNGSSGEDV